MRMNTYIKKEIWSAKTKLGIKYAGIYLILYSGAVELCHTVLHMTSFKRILNQFNSSISKMPGCSHQNVVSHLDNIQLSVMSEMIEST